MARTPSKQRNSLTPFYVILGVVALAGVGVLLSQFLGGGGEAATRPVPVTLDPAELARVQGVAMGREDAPVVIYEFADFQCPGCGQFAAFVAPLIKERLVDPGLVRYVYYDFPLPQHAHAFLAARAARCAGEQDRFWEYHDLVFARQPSWSGLSDATDFFVDLAREAGIDRGAFEQCLRSDRFAEEVSRNVELGRSLGVQSTPTLFVNMKRLPEVPSFTELEQLVQEEIDGAAPADTAPAAAAPPS